MALLPDYGNRPFLNNPYVWVGAGSLLTGLIWHWRSVTKVEEPVVAMEPQKAGQVGVSTSNLNEAQAQAFKAALPAHGRQYADVFVQVGKETGVSPFMLAGFMEQESNYGKGCKKMPECRGYAGDDYGLMQINIKAHPAFFQKTVNGVPAYQVPLEVVRYGAKVFKGDLAFFSRQGSGTYRVGPKKAAQLATTPGNKPDTRPLSGTRLLWAAAAAYNAGAGNVMQALVSDRSFDAVTTGGNYGKKVLERAERIVQQTNAALGGTA